jgi:hypothetical protein
VIRLEKAAKQFAFGDAQQQSAVYFLEHALLFGAAKRVIQIQVRRNKLNNDNVRHFILMCCIYTVA